MIPTPVPAATVMLLRDGSDGMEVFMIVRHEKSDVHAGALVFPGGRAEPEDYELAVDATVFPALEGIDPVKAALRVAAVRETFEECGVLLARPRGEEALVSAARLRDIEAAHRDAIMGGQRTLRCRPRGGGIRARTGDAGLLRKLDHAGAILQALRRAFLSRSGSLGRDRRARRLRGRGFGVDHAPTALERAEEGTYSLRFPTG